MGHVESPTLTLYADSLCSKWGFNDGDEPENLLDYWDEIGVRYTDLDWHTALRTLVRERLVPAMEAAGHVVEVYNIVTNHNPIRARRIDGVEVDDYRGAAGALRDLRPEFVVVPYEEIARACGLTPVVR